MQVRKQAQNALSSCVDTYLYAGRNILPDIMPFLKHEDGVSHEQFKVINKCRLYHEVEVSTRFTHRGPKPRGCANRVETDTE